MKVLENVQSKNMWPTTTYTFSLKNVDNNLLKKEILKREQKGLGFKFDPIQGGGWQSNKNLLYDNWPKETPNQTFKDL